MKHQAYAITKDRTIVVGGVLTTEHSASSYGKPVFVANNNEGQAYAGRVISPTDGMDIALAVDLDHIGNDAFARRVLEAASASGYTIRDKGQA